MGYLNSCASWLILIAFATLLLSGAWCDRMVVPVSNIDVYGPGQKAIVAWNGEEEVLILSTDVYSEERSKAVELLPLPSKPTLIQEANKSSFLRIADLIQSGYGFLGKGRGTRAVGVQIVFHEVIGPHDISVAKASSPSSLQEWLSSYLSKMGLGSAADRFSSSSIKALIDSYISSGYPYFLVDIIDLSTSSRSVSPIMVLFDSPSLFYPLRVSTSMRGETDLDLFVIAKGPVRATQVPHPLSLGRYQGPLNRAVRVKLSHDELRSIDPRVARLFPGEAWLSALTFSGSIDLLSEDVSIAQIRPLPGEVLVASPYFWLPVGVVLGIFLGLLLAHISLGALAMEPKRLTSAADFLVLMVLLVLASVLPYRWSLFAFWIIVPLSIAALYFTVRTSTRKRLAIYILCPFFALLFIACLIVGEFLSIVVSTIFLLGFMLAAAFPPSDGRRISDAFRRTSRWVRASRYRHL